MPSFDSPYFQIELPTDTVDASSYCFALPSSGRFHPSIVIKFDDLPPGEPLRRYADKQVREMQTQLKNFQMLSPLQQESQLQVSFHCVWGDGDSRFHQYQIFRQQRTRVYLITGTLLEGGTQHSTDLEAVMRSFIPK